MINAALYPYHADLLAFTRHFNSLQHTYQLTTLISPAGFALDGKDAAYACAQPDIGLLVTEEISCSSSHWDTLLLLYGMPGVFLSDSAYIETMEEAIVLGKNVKFVSYTASSLPKSICE